MYQRNNLQFQQIKQENVHNQFNREANESNPDFLLAANTDATLRKSNRELLTKECFHEANFMDISERFNTSKTKE